MRILIVGAGIAGTTLAALLQGRGHHIDLVERSPDFSKSGYALSLWPLGSRILIGLDLIDAFRKVANPMGTYHLRNGAGELISAYELADKIAVHGDAGTLSRRSLLELLRGKLIDTSLRMNTQLDALQQDGQSVSVSFNDGSQATYDLVVGADGIHSKVRQLIAAETALHETGWGGWVWWAPKGVIAVDDVTEYWGAGRFLGLYPCANEVCVFAGGPMTSDLKSRTHGTQDIREHFSALTPGLPNVFDALPEDPSEIFFWKLDDIRAKTWSTGRVVLLGDAATAFLPTAGVGASHAMESAAVLADELLRVEASTVQRALRLFELRHRKRVEAAQNDSRNLAKVMLVSSTPLAWARDELMKHYSVDKFIASIMQSLDQPI
jgi:2-polyprenyl-6-methoxyphenol hydroxylase-like FAD-dependent oxidoreductase